MSIPIWQIDAFAAEPFTGNPAAVCLLDSYPADSWLQNVAVEMNLSETAFVVPAGDPGRFHLRWFTPAAEVDLCGHATLASAHLLFEQAIVEENQSVHFQTRSGELVCGKEADRITMNFPSTPIVDSVDSSTAKEVCSLLGVVSAKVVQSKYDLVAIIDDANTVRSLTPDFSRMKRLPTRGLIATARSSDPEFDFISRFFAPMHNIDEDPVTGSAHCCLAPYWSEILSKRSLVAYQASKRGGTVGCEVDGDRIKLSGRATTVLEGRLLVRPQDKN